jgi:hypothetical protein
MLEVDHVLETAVRFGEADRRLPLLSDDRLDRIGG